MSAIGHLTLNISLGLYLFQFVPQIIHNYRQQTTAHISLFTHSLMITANSLDLIYGFGFGLEWQYRLVTMISLSFLMVQQWQIFMQHKSPKLALQSVGVISILVLAIVIAHQHALPHNILLAVGMTSSTLYWSYWFPQIWFNYRLKKADGFSVIFLSIVLLGAICDFISATCLGWPYPSLISPIVIATMMLIMLYQRFIYSEKKLNTTIVV